MQYAPTKTEGAAAATIHGASIFLPFIAPIIGCAVSGRSEFVRAHALQSLKEAIVGKLIVLAAFLISGCFTIYRLINLYQNDWKDLSVTEFVVRALMGWSLLYLFALVTNIFSVRQALRALRGEWPKTRRS